MVTCVGVGDSWGQWTRFTELDALATQRCSRIMSLGSAFSTGVINTFLDVRFFIPVCLESKHSVTLQTSRIDESAGLWLPHACL